MCPDIFEPVVPEDRLDPRFIAVAMHESQAPARAMARRVFAEFEDPDGNFVEQFQTTAFDARTWELFLFAYVVDAGFSIERGSGTPDFICEKGGQTVAIEATTANPSGGGSTHTTLEGLEQSAKESEEETLRRIQHEIPIRLGSPLFSKLQRRYWELDHVARLPLILAIESFAAEDALYFSDTGLGSYLYGLWPTPWRTAGGELVVTSVPVTEHRDGSKVIPSAFFSQPDAENVSAVLFGNTGTFPKFGRMALQVGIDSEQVRMFRVGTCYDHDPNASDPLTFGYDVAERPREWGFAESWGEGLGMYHNPNAVRPLDATLFPNIAHHRLEGGRITSTVPRFHPFMSQTRTLWVRPNDDHRS